MKRLLLVLIAFVALCAAAAPVSAQDCEVVLKGKSSKNKWCSIRISKATHPLGFADTFSSESFWNAWKKEIGRDFGQYGEWDREDWDNEIEVVEFHGGDCGDAGVQLFEHPEWTYEGWVEVVRPDHPVIRVERKEQASSFRILFGDDFHQYKYHYNIQAMAAEDVFKHHAERAATLDIGVGADGSVWRVDTGHRVWHLDPNTDIWSPVEGKGAQIAVDANGHPWVVAGDHTVWRYDPNADGFLHSPGGLLDIAIGADGSVLGIGLDNTVWKWNGEGFGPFDSGQGAQIAVDPNGHPWVVAGDHTVWRYDPNAGGFLNVPGGLLDIAIGADGSVLGIGLDNTIWKWNGEGFGPFGSGQGAQIAVDANGNPWVVAGDHTIWRYDPNAGGFLAVDVRLF
jgi:hypothetical protein